MTLYHGGNLDEPGPHLWATADPDYASAFADLWEGDVWELTIDLGVDDILDLTPCGLDVNAVASVLTDAGLPVSVHEDDTRLPHVLLRRVSESAIRAAGYRAVRICEWVDWGDGERHTQSVYLVDLNAIVERRPVTLAEQNVRP